MINILMTKSVDFSIFSEKYFFIQSYDFLSIKYSKEDLCSRRKNIFFYQKTLSLLFFFEKKLCARYNRRNYKNKI